jgi:hypothetical protein
MNGAIYVLINASAEVIDHATGDYRYFDKAEGGRFYKLAIDSVASLKKHMPDLPVTLFTNMEMKEDNLFDDIIHIEPKDMWMAKYEAMMKTPYERTVHIDCDTYICDTFLEIFTLLDKFDLALPMSVHYYSKNRDVAPPSFTEPSGGMIVWKNTEKMRSVWQEVYDLMVVMSLD